MSGGHKGQLTNVLWTQGIIDQLLVDARHKRPMIGITKEYVTNDWWTQGTYDQ